MSNINVIVHFGAEEAAYEGPASETVATVKERALRLLKIVVDPNVEYFLTFEGQTIQNETQTLLELLQGKLRERMEFLLKKRPKGG
jgi:hypothetical protein